MSTFASRIRPLGPLALVLFILLAVSIAIPRSASADSVIYVKGGDIWLSTPDGQRNRQLTSTGEYSYASQSDNGVIVAVSGNRIHRLSRTGEVLAQLPTVNRGSGWFGPFEPQISPDGQTVAYEFFTNSGGDVVNGTAYASAQDGTMIGELQTGWAYPAWIDNDTTMQSGAPNGLTSDVIVRGVGQPNNEGTQWFSHPDAGGVRDGDISRNGAKLAFVAGENDEYLTIYNRTGELGVDVPEYCYHYGDATGGRFRSPAFSPDGSSLAWEEGDGIYIGPIPDFAGGCSLPEIEGPLIIPGGTYPDWGPADVPADVPVQRSPTVRATGKPKLRTALRKGLMLTTTDLPAGTKVMASIAKSTAKKAGLGKKSRVVARGTVNAAAKARLRFTGPVARKLGKLKSVPMTVTAAGGGVKASLKLTLRR
jgi:hypothetical protein